MLSLQNTIQYGVTRFNLKIADHAAGVKQSVRKDLTECCREAPASKNLEMWNMLRLLGSGALMGRKEKGMKKFLSFLRENIYYISN